MALKSRAIFWVLIDKISLELNIGVGDFACIEEEQRK
jgi:hypothetical protein